MNVAVCGEALIDEIERPNGDREAHVGGSPANTAIALSSLGIPTQLITRVGEDEYAQRLQKSFHAAHLEMSALQISERPTTVAKATLDRSGNATYAFSIDDTWEAIADIDAAVLIVSGALALPVDSMFAAIDSAVERFNGTVVFDLNIRPALISSRELVLQRMNKWIERADIVKASADDVAWAYPSQSFEDITQRWIDGGASRSFITDGGNGAVGRSQDEYLQALAPQVKVVDTVGAGDTFTAGIISRLHANLYAQLQFAANLAAEACTHAGGPATL